MLLKLFLTFLKINFICTSGPASLGLTKQIVVPAMISEDKFIQIASIASGIPGSDAMQMAWQVGFAVKGWLGALVSVIGALLPTLLLLGIVYLTLSFINPKIISKFFSGVNPALSVLLVVTALSIFKAPTPAHYVIALVAAVMFYFKIPIYLVLILAGLISVTLL